MSYPCIEVERKNNQTCNTAIYNLVYETMSSFYAYIAQSFARLNTLHLILVFFIECVWINKMHFSIWLPWQNPVLD